MTDDEAAESFWPPPLTILQWLVGVTAGLFGGTGLWAGWWLVQRYEPLQPASEESLVSFATALAGIVGTPWAFAGMLLVLLAFLGQQKELIVQQEELRLSRQELKEQRVQLTAQTGQFQRQQDESTFFNMLNSLDTVVASLTARNSTGRMAFGTLWGQLREAYKKDTAHANSPENEKIAAVTGGFYRQYEMTLGPYLNQTVLILRLIDGSTALSEVDKDLYASLLAARISREEALILMYSLFRPTSKPEARDLFARWSLLRNFPDLPPLHADHKDRMDARIFGKQQ